MPDISAADAYNRGVRDGEGHVLRASIDKAHERLDKHDTRLTALERVMYAGMGVLLVVEMLPNLSAYLGK